MTGGSLDGRGAVVTGGGHGIGAQVARSLAAAGAAVVVAARTESEVERVASEIRALGAKAWSVRCDVTDEESVKRLGDECRRALGGVDILVNNAGAAASAPIKRIELDDWNRMFAMNATSTFLCTREFAPRMVERGWGRVVNIASLVGLEGGKYVAHYSASKHAVVGFTRSAAIEFAGSGVTVNAVCPGYVDTPMTARTLAYVQSKAGLAPDRALAAVLATVGQERLVTPGEVAAAVLDLCRDEAGGVNGQAIVIRGGVRTP